MASSAWTETEINILIQAWSEIDASHPSGRNERGEVSLRKKLHDLFLQRSTLPRTAAGLNHMKYALRGFAQFVHHFDNERKQEGGRSWYDLDEDEREEHRIEVPYTSRGLISALSQETFERLMRMERAKKWIGEGVVDYGSRPTQTNTTTTSTLLQPRQLDAVANSVENNSPQSSFETTSTEPDNMEVGFEDAVTVQEQEVFGRSPHDVRAVSTPTPTAAAGKKKKKAKKRRRNFKHRDCNILLESMMELQNKQVHQAFRKLRADIVSEIRHSTDTLKSVIPDQFDELDDGGGDAAFISRVLNMQEKQVKDRFDQFEENRKGEESANRAILGQRFDSQS